MALTFIGSSVDSVSTIATILRRKARVLIQISPDSNPSNIHDIAVWVAITEEEDGSRSLLGVQILDHRAGIESMKIDYETAIKGTIRMALIEEYPNADDAVIEEGVTIVYDALMSELLQAQISIPF